MSTDAVVIGAGPNGLIAANHLADAGWKVVVCEEQPEPGGAVPGDDQQGRQRRPDAEGEQPGAAGQQQEHQQAEVRPPPGPPREPDLRPPGHAPSLRRRLSCAGSWRR